MGLVTDERYKIFEKKLKLISKAQKDLDKMLSASEVRKLYEQKGESSLSINPLAREVLKRTNISIFDIKEHFNLFKNIPENILNYVQTEVKYSGYLKRQQMLISQMRKNEQIKLPADFDYSQIKGLRIEAQQKLNKFKPLSLGQASRISGVSPADIAVLTVYISMKNKQDKLKNGDKNVREK